MKLWLSIICFSLLIGCKKNEPANNDNLIKEGEKGQQLDSLLTPYVQELRKFTDNTAGLAIGVTKGEKIIFARTFGYAQIKQAKNVDLNTLFHLASVSKPFCAVAIAKLNQENKIKLDNFIIDYIPEFKMLGNGYDKITIEHILTHTSGIPRNIAPDDWLNPSYSGKALEENLEIIKNHELDFEPGSKFSYSNSAFDILGIIISRVSGMHFDEYIEKEILTPTGMMNTSFTKAKDVLPFDWASSYSYGLETQEWFPYPYNERLFPSSGVVTSIIDMCKWGQMHVGQGTINDVQILDEEHFNLVVSLKYDTPWGDKIGLSWFLQSYLGRPIIMHTGEDTGFETIMYIYPEDNISIVVLANRDFSKTGRIVNAASEILFGEKPKEYNISAKYKFADAFKEGGIENAIAVWAELKKDTLDNYYVEDEDVLTTGAILENGKRWKESKDVLEYYITLDENSTYAWRLLGNANFKPENWEYKDSPRLFEPGTRWHYGTSTNWVGKIIEKVSGQDLETYFKENITGPLKMKRTFFNVPDSLTSAIVSWGSRDSTGFEETQRIPQQSVTSYRGDGGLFSTPNDYLTFLECLLNEGEYDNGRILKAETVEMMFKNQMHSNQNLVWDIPEGKLVSPYGGFTDESDKHGLTWAIENSEEETVRTKGTGYWAGIGNSYYTIDNKKGIAVVYFTQFLPFNDKESFDFYRYFEKEAYLNINKN